MIEKYESLASDLLEWIEQTIIILNNRKFANSLVGVQQQLQAFNTYRTVEKPPKSVHAQPKSQSPAPLLEMNVNVTDLLTFEGSQKKETWRFFSSPSRVR